MRATARLLNILALYAIALVLLAGFGLQFIRGELPCPLCLLQRAMFCALAAGPILNLRHQPRPSHYALSMLAALIGAAVSARQMLLHILPGDRGYGSPILGYHYYTWAFLLFAAALVLLALMLLLEGQFSAERPPRASGAAAVAAVWLAIGLAAANALSTLAICGLQVCPDNPVRYELWQR